MKKFLFIVTIWCSVSCSNHQKFTTNKQTQKIKHDTITKQISPAEKWLNCLSKDMFGSVKSPKKIYITDINNNNPDFTDIALPIQFKDFVNISLSRVYNGVETYNLIHPLPATDEVYIITGSLFCAQKKNVFDKNNEIFNIGKNEQITTYQLSFTLSLTENHTGKQIATNAKTVEIYSSSKSNSLFFSINELVTNINKNIIEIPNINYAIQYLSDYCVASILKEFAAKQFHKDFSFCEKIMYSEKNIDEYSQNKVFDVKLSFNNKNELCITIKKLKNLKLSKLKLTLTQFATKHFSMPISKRYGEKTSKEIENQIITTDIRSIKSHAKSFTLFIEDENNNILGYGYL